jgi:hypothetical protein
VWSRGSGHIICEGSLEIWDMAYTQCANPNAERLPTRVKHGGTACGLVASQLLLSSSPDACTAVFYSAPDNGIVRAGEIASMRWRLLLGLESVALTDLSVALAAVDRSL